MLSAHGCVCVALFYQTDIGESLCTVPGLHRERAKGDAATIRDRRRPNLTLSQLDNLGCPDPHPPPSLRRWLHRSPPLPLRTDPQLLR